MIEPLQLLKNEYKLAPDYPKQVTIYNRKLTKNITSTIAYMLGIKEIYLEKTYKDDCPDFMDEIENNKHAKIIRILCQLRTAMLRDYKTINNNLLSLINIDNMSVLINYDDVTWLKTNSIDIFMANASADQYITSINRIILANIDKCRSLIPGWVEWDYIRDLFLMPGCYMQITNNMKIDVLNKAKKKYWENKMNYPYQTYINWPKRTMEDNGNILMNDEKFLDILYKANGSVFSDYGHVRDAGDNIKMNVHNFIDNSLKTVLVVDCENCDVYNLFSTLHNLNPTTLQKLSKIILYDGTHTTSVWSFISKYIRVPVEHLCIERVSKYKSLNDVSLTAGVCREYFKNDVESFILASSDSDFWGLINSIPEARFLVLVEYSKCGDAFMETMDKAGIYYCAMDDFGKGNIEEFKEMAFRASLQRYVDGFNENGVWAIMDVDELVDVIFDECRFTGTDKQIISDKLRYQNKFIKAIRMELFNNESGKKLQMSIGV